MLQIRCPCGEVFHAEERHVGSQIRCWRCAQVVPIAPPESQQLHRPSTLLDFPGEGIRGTSRPNRPHLWLGRNRALVLVVVGFLVAVGLAIGFLRDPGKQPSHVAAPRAEAPRQAPVPPDGGQRSEAPPIRQPMSLPNGTILYRRQEQRGLGELSLTNGNRRDAVAALYERTGGPKPYLSVYVRAGQGTTFQGIPAGTYRIRFMLGVDWKGKKFARERESFEFLDTFEFTESVTETGTEYVRFELTLHRVVGGTTRFRPIPESELDI